MSTRSLEVDQVDVLVIGAGPAGLSTALSLHHHLYQQPPLGQLSRPPLKTKILLVDARFQNQNESRASVMHARTLECLKSISCVQPLLARGSISERTFFTSAPDPDGTGTVLLNAEFKFLEGKTEFPFSLLIPQHVTETILGQLVEERFVSIDGLSFVRGVRMIGMNEESREVDGKRTKGLLVSFDNGQTVWTRYLVGADGGRSVVRSLAQISFSDPTSSSPSLFSRLFLKLFPSPFQFQPSYERTSENATGLPACITDIVFTQSSSAQLLKQHPGMQHGLFITFGSDGFFLISPLRLGPDEREKYGFDKNGRGERFIYRVGFTLLPGDVEVGRRVFGSTSNSNGNSGTSVENGLQQLSRDDYISTPEAIALVQRKINRGVRYTPQAPGSLTESEYQRRRETSGLAGDDLKLEDVHINPTMGNIPKVEKVIWASMFRIRQAIAETFYKPLGKTSDTEGDGSGLAHILLVGDAAHIHSPAGGQGMNLGIRDGIECGKAIADHLELSNSSQASAGSQANPLEAYADARHQEALDTIAVTNNLSRMMMMAPGSFAGWCRNYGLWIVGRLSFARRKMIWRLSGLGTGKAD